MQGEREKGKMPKDCVGSTGCGRLVYCAPNLKTMGRAEKRAMTRK